MEYKDGILRFLCETNLDLTDQIAIGDIDGRLYVSADISTAPIDTDPNSPSNGCPTSIRIFSRRMVGAEPFEKLVEIPFLFTNMCVYDECAGRPGAKTFYTIYEDEIYALASGHVDSDPICMRTGWHMFRICIRTGSYRHFRSRLPTYRLHSCFKCIDNKLWPSKVTRNSDGTVKRLHFIMNDTKVVERPSNLQERFFHKLIREYGFALNLKSGMLEITIRNTVRPPCCVLRRHYRNHKTQSDNAFQVFIHRYSFMFNHKGRTYTCQQRGENLSVTSESTWTRMNNTKTLSLFVTLISTEKRKSLKRNNAELTKVYSDDFQNQVLLSWIRETFLTPESRDLFCYYHQMRKEPRRKSQTIRLRGEWLKLFPRGPNGIRSNTILQIMGYSTMVMMHGRYIYTIILNFIPQLRYLMALKLQDRWCSVTDDNNPGIKYIRSALCTDEMYSRLADVYWDNTATA